MAEQMTKEGYEKLKQKLEELKAKRPKISKAIGEAREHGDLRENSAYHAAKEEQGLNEMRIREMEAKIETAIIVDPSQMPKGDRVILGSTVKIKALDNGDEFEYTLVSASEADVLEKKISPESPIGEAILNQEKGSVVEVEIPRGLVKYRIMEIT
jgi:transcription elongation factor GreA